MSNFYHPETPIKRAMTDSQFALLDRVCRSNGGGVSAYACDRHVLNALVNRHFVQGKAGNLSSVVHTREGLDAWKAERERRS